MTQLGLPDVSHCRPERVQVLDLEPGDRGMMTSKLDEIRHYNEIKSIEVIDTEI